MNRPSIHSGSSNPKPAGTAVDLPAFLRRQANGTLLSAKVQPRASRNEIGELQGDELKVRVTAPPVDAAANEAVLRLLAEALGCPRGSVQLLRGATSRHKSIFIADMTPVEVMAKLRENRKSER